jgi:hypothetical protein
MKRVAKIAWLMVGSPIIVLGSAYEMVRGLFIVGQVIGVELSGKIYED